MRRSLMAKVFVIDIGHCSGCYNCQLVCKDEFAGNDWSPYSKPQPDVGQFWMHIDEYICGTIPKVKLHYIPHLCNHCENPACMSACEHQALYKRDDGLIILDPGKCKGCRKCQAACPYDAIFFNEELNICQKCSGCAHLLDNGDLVPRCVEACPNEAIIFGEESELTEYIAGAAVLKPESGCNPRVYYRNIPGKFIAGAVYDPDKEEIIKGAVCTLVGEGQTYQAVTDGFGDFWFKDLKKGAYDLIITAEGFEDKTFKALSTKEKDVNIGDIPLQRKA
jgi:tetrathionate reductase subunit B